MLLFDLIAQNNGPHCSQWPRTCSGQVRCQAVCTYYLYPYETETIVSRLIFIVVKKFDWILTGTWKNRTGIWTQVQISPKSFMTTFSLWCVLHLPLRDKGAFCAAEGKGHPAHWWAHVDAEMLSGVGELGARSEKERGKESICFNPGW